jgi:hypothetical protein
MSLCSWEALGIILYNGEVNITIECSSDLVGKMEIVGGNIEFDACF